MPPKMDDGQMMRCMMTVVHPPFKQEDGTYHIPDSQKLLDPYGDYPDRVFTDLTDAAQELWAYTLMRLTITDVSNLIKGE